MKKSLALILIASLLISCSPQKKLNRLIKRHPELVKIDTISIDIDSLLPAQTFAFPDIEGFFRPLGDDTIFLIPADFYQDTIEIEDESILIRLVRKHTPGDILGTRLEVTGSIKPRPISLTATAQVQKINNINQTWLDRWGLYLKIVLGIIILVLVYKIFRLIM